MREYAVEPDLKPGDEKITPGSGWIIPEYISLAVDIFAINSLMGFVIYSNT